MATTKNTKSVDDSVKATSELKTDNDKKAYTEDDVKKLIASAIADYSATQAPQQTIVQVAKDEYVTVLYLGAIAAGTTVCVGNLGQITYSGGTLDIPKKDFIHGLGVPVINALLRKRSLIVVEGLTDEERARFGLLYNEGELLNTGTYYKLFDLKSEEISKIYSKLCDTHKRLVAQMYISAYFEHRDNRINMETVKMLNKLSRVVDKAGLFTPILEDMGKQLVEEDE